MISISKNFRSAAIVGMAVAALAGTSALAANLNTQSPSHSTHAKASTAPNAKVSPEAAETPDVNGHSDAAPQTDKPLTAGDAHGDCVSAVAKSDATATAHGHTNHGAAVSHAARVTCDTQ